MVRMLCFTDHRGFKACFLMSKTFSLDINSKPGLFPALLYFLLYCFNFFAYFIALSTLHQFCFCLFLLWHCTVGPGHKTCCTAEMLLFDFDNSFSSFADRMQKSWKSHALYTQNPKITIFCFFLLFQLMFWDGLHCNRGVMLTYYSLNDVSNSHSFITFYYFRPLPDLCLLEVILHDKE